MGKAKRIMYVVTGLFMIASSVIMSVFYEVGYIVVLIILEIMLFAHGIRLLFYYFTLARYMVGGISIFYKGILFLDSGLFALNMDDIPRPYAMVYLVGCLIVSGVIDVMRANTARKLESAHWKYQCSSGIIKIIVSVICLCLINSPAMLTIIYSLGLLHAGIGRIATAFRETDIVYVK